MVASGMVRGGGAAGGAGGRAAAGAAGAAGADGGGGFGAGRALQEQGGALGRDLGGTSVYLVGMMGSGKSTVAGVLAGALGYTPVDVDALIEGATGRPVRAIFEAEGEETFRELETETLRQILPLARTVVATGGGAVLRRENWGLMRQAVVVHLDPPVEVLAARLDGQEAGPGDRPLLAGDTLAELGRIAEERAQFYREADVRVEVTADMEAEAVAAAVCREVGRKMKAKKDEEEDRKNFTIEYDGEGAPPRQDGKRGFGSPQ